MQIRMINAVEHVATNGESMLKMENDAGENLQISPIACLQLIDLIAFMPCIAAEARKRILALNTLNFQKGQTNTGASVGIRGDVLHAKTGSPE